VAFWSKKPKQPSIEDLETAYNHSTDIWKAYLHEMAAGLNGDDPKWLEMSASEEMVRLLTDSMTKMAEFELAVAPLMPQIIATYGPNSPMVPDYDSIRQRMKDASLELVRLAMTARTSHNVMEYVSSILPALQETTGQLRAAASGSGTTPELLAGAKTVVELASNAESECRRALADATSAENGIDRSAFVRQFELLDTLHSAIDQTKALFAQAQEVRTIDRFSPMVRVAMAMARADGKLVPEEIRVIIDIMMNSFGLSKAEKPALQALMKEPVPSDLQATVEQAIGTAPDRDTGRKWVLSILLAVAKADGVVHPDELEVIRRVAKHSGWSDAQFVAYAEDNGLQSKDPWEVLGVQRGANLAEVKTAYRNLISSYHPDRVAQLPQEFQRLAHVKSIEITASYESLTLTLRG
jgi:DnaJ like chaperone protein